MIDGSFRHLSQKKPPTPTCRANSDCKKLKNSICVKGSCKCKIGFYRSNRNRQCKVCLDHPPSKNLECVRRTPAPTPLPTPFLPLPFLLHPFQLPLQLHFLQLHFLQLPFQLSVKKNSTVDRWDFRPSDCASLAPSSVLQPLIVNLKRWRFSTTTA